MVNIHGDTLLLSATRKDRVECAMVLIKYPKTPLNHVAKCGRNSTALHLAVTHGLFPLVCALVRHGANTTIRWVSRIRIWSEQGPHNAVWSHYCSSSTFRPSRFMDCTTSPYTPPATASGDTGFSEVIASRGQNQWAVLERYRDCDFHSSLSCSKRSRRSASITDGDGFPNIPAGRCPPAIVDRMVPT